MTSESRKRCEHPDVARVPLPLAGGGKVRMRPTTIGRWRAAVLIGVHVLIALHIAHWLSTGQTLTPVEPSEAMEFSKHGLINAGLIFFALAILSTLVLGRWFCGWACHLVALQDLCRWLLKRAGIRPRPLRSDVLMLVPLLAFLYMFIAPWLYRALSGDVALVRGVHLATDDFWATFPSWLPATLTFITCGFVAVYFLGQKGFCTYGCPYGGIFAIADRAAPMRIRVTDACDQCGHCTASCTSNVRVHAEVRDYGMVVDPGCMKCLDCVSVCPNEALYVGFAPSVQRKALPKPALAAGATSAGRWLLWGGFALAALLLFVGYDRHYQWIRADLAVALALAGLSVAVVWSMRARRPSGEAAPLADEVVLAAAFLLAMAAFRGLYGMVAFLFALGLSAVLACLALQATRLLRRRDVMAGGVALRREGRLTGRGWLAAGGAVVLLVATAHSGIVQLHTQRLAITTDALSKALLRLTDPAATARSLEAAEERALRAALLSGAALERLAPLLDPETELRRAHVWALAGRLVEYQRGLERLVARYPAHDAARLELGEYYEAVGRQADALRLYEDLTARRPLRATGYVRQARLLTLRGEAPAAREVLSRGLERRPADAELLSAAAAVELAQGRVDAALELLEAAAAAAAGRADVRLRLGQLLREVGRAAEALPHLHAALALHDSPEVRLSLAAAQLDLGDYAAAETHARELVSRLPEAPLPLHLLAEVLDRRGDAAGAAAAREAALRLEAGAQRP